MTNLEQFREVTPAGRLTLQASSMLKVRLENDLIQTKSVRWDLSGRRALRAQGRWPERFFKKAVIGKGVQLMTLMGSGDVFIARDKQDHVL